MNITSVVYDTLEGKHLIPDIKTLKIVVFTRNKCSIMVIKKPANGKPIIINNRRESSYSILSTYTQRTEKQMHQSQTNGARGKKTQ